MINTASKLYDKLFNIYTTQYGNVPEYNKKRVSVLNCPENVTLDFDEDYLPPMPQLEVAKEVKLEPQETAEKIKLSPQKGKITGTGLEILIPRKLLTRLPILLAQVKAGNNSEKYCIYFRSTIKSLKSFTTT